MSFRNLLALLLLALLGVFVAMNLQKANVWCFGARAEMPIAMLVFVAGMLGFFAGLLIAFFGKSKKK
jgi:uncharacterized integral membrane protein